MMIFDLSSDLESEILCRVPSKSLVKLQTTCKRWYALFNDSKFVEKNLVKSKLEVFLLMSFRVYSVNVNTHGIHKGIDPSMEFRGKLNALKDSGDIKISEIYHCDGLILCLTTENTRIVVWNPCTTETRWIKPRSCNRYYDLYALGYRNIDSSCRSYKILRICRPYNDHKIRVGEIELYELSSDSWRVLDVDTHDWNIISLRGVALKENAYWVAFHKESGVFLLNFDFTTKRFRRLPLPYQSHYSGATAVLSAIKDERLSVLSQRESFFSSVMKIWVSNDIVDTKDMSWSIFLVVDLEKLMLPVVTDVISFLLDEENKVAVCCDTDVEAEDLHVGDTEDKEWTRVYIEDIFKEVYKERMKREHC